MIGSFYFARKWKVYLALFSAIAAYYKQVRKEKLVHQTFRFSLSFKNVYVTATDKLTLFESFKTV